MSRFVVTTVVDASPARVFDLSLDIDVHVGSMSASGERAVAGRTSGRIGLGEEVTWRARHFGVPWRMTSRISELERPHRFVDEQVRGPFASFRHEHRFEAVPEGRTRMTDDVTFRAPLGPLGTVVDRLLLGRYLRGLIEERNRFLAERAARAA